MDYGLRNGRRSAWRLSAALSVAITGLFAWTAPAWAEPRIALVIGNGDYEKVTPLDNPVGDGELMATTLEDVGFDVTLLINGEQGAIKRAVADFGRKLRAAGPDATGLFYFAGHGVQSRGVNFLLPTDSAIQDEADLDLVAVQADWVLRQLFSARNRTNIVILDACRNNPFESFSGTAEHGLAEMNAPTGTFIAYASAPGSVALDGAAGTHSPFTEALSAAILTEGEPIEQVFKQVRISVFQKTGGRQTPWDSSSLTSEFYFEPPAPVNPEDVAARQLWNTVKQTGDPVQIILFLRQYPDSSVSGEARALLETSIEDLGASGKQPAPAAVSPPPVTVAPPAPPPAEPAPREEDLIAQAQATGALADYEAYLAAYPDGVFASLAIAEIENLRATAAAPPPGPALTLVAPETANPEPATESPRPDSGSQTITFLTPLARGFAPIAGRSIAQIIKGSPQYPPVEGLPDSFWKDRHCMDCHNWTKEALCTQGQTYLTTTGEFALDKQHPLDGFKQVLREWAADGCQ